MKLIIGMSIISAISLFSIPTILKQQYQKRKDSQPLHLNHLSTLLTHSISYYYVRKQTSSSC